MKHHAISASTDGTTTGRRQAVTSLEQWVLRISLLDIRPRNRLRRGISHVVLGVREAMRRVEQEIRIAMQNEIGCLDQGPVAVCITAVEKLHGVANGREAVFLHLLQQNWRADFGLHAVVAVAAVTDAVAVYLEYHVPTAVLVPEAGWVNRSSLVQTARERLVPRNVWACGIGALRNSNTNTVVPDLLLGLPGVV